MVTKCMMTEVILKGYFLFKGKIIIKWLGNNILHSHVTYYDGIWKIL